MKYIMKYVMTNICCLYYSLLHMSDHIPYYLVYVIMSICTDILPVHLHRHTIGEGQDNYPLLNLSVFILSYYQYYFAIF